MINYLNYYHCPNDGKEWVDLWSCMCNDKCPLCDAEIEPYRSEEIKAAPAHESSMQY
jgi:hypothetical protein